MWAHPLHHAVLAAYFPVWLLSNNMTMFDTSDVLRPLALSVALSLVAFFALRRLYRNAHKAAAVTSAGILLFYCFALIREALSIESPGTVTSLILAAVFLIIALAVFRARRFGGPVSMVLNGFAIALFLLPVVRIATSGMDAFAGETPNTDARDVLKLSATKPPTIVHIVLDGYARADVLKELFGHDNTDFVESLRDAGFAVADRATAPYSQTLLSMNAVFALDYVNDRVADLAASGTMDDVRHALTADLDQSLVLRSLRAAGYPIIAVESLYNGVALPTTDRVISSADSRLGLTYFEAVLLHYTPVERLLVKLGIDDATHRKPKFSLAAHDLSGLTPPYFLYNHVVAPHPPFNMTDDGALRTDTFGMGDGSEREKMDAAWYGDYRTGYLEKLRYTNKAILAKIARLKEQVPDPKIIVIHSDHGSGMYLHKEDLAGTCLKERLSPLLAVYSSYPRLQAAIAPDINLVNLYRIIFREAFNADLNPLPNRSYFAPWSHPEQLTRIGRRDLADFGPMCTQSGFPAIGVTTLPHSYSLTRITPTTAINTSGN